MIKRLTELAGKMRLLGLDMAYSTGSGGSHIGGGFSVMEILAVVYGEFLRRYPDGSRDLFIPSKSHCTLAHFPALYFAGFLKREDCFRFQENGSAFVGYPYNEDLGLDFSGGTLGMGLSYGIGRALAFRLDQKPNRVFVLVGDGELNEGSIWEGLLVAAKYQLANLTLIVDRNHLQYDGDTEAVLPLEDLAAKFRAFNWATTNCNGHSVAELVTAFSQEETRPKVIIADTVKGKGISFAENRPEWHHHALTKEQYEAAKAELEQAGEVER